MGNSGAGDPQTYHYERVDRIADIFWGVAAAGGTIHYAQLAERLGIQANWLGGGAGGMLGVVSRRAVEHNEPIWTALVVSSQTERPKDYFFDTARSLRSEYADLPDDAVWQAEMQRCYRAALGRG
jgi:hypothetical protein